MRLKGFLILFFSLFYTYSSFAQSKGELTQSRILILLDESSSMIQKWPNGKEKYKAADELILRLMDSIYAINPDVEFSLRVFGHQYTVEQNNCYDTKNEVAFSKDNRTQMALRLDDIHPLGVTPISYALLQAAKYDLVDEEHNAYSIILFTDGGESCGGDICEVMKKLMKYKVYFKPYIVSLEDDPALKNTYSCMGDFLQVTKDADMPRAVTTIVNAFRPAIKITKADYKQLQTLAANVPSALKVNIPVIKQEEQEQKVIKKESEEIPKPVKKKVDTIAKLIVKAPEKPAPPKPDTVAAPKPVTKIKIDEPRVKPMAEKIEHIITTKYNLIYTSTPIAKTLKTITVPEVEIIVIPPTEHLSGITPAEQKQIIIAAPSAKLLKTIALPEIEIAVKPEPDHITGITAASLKPINNPLPQPKKIDLVATPPIPEIVVPVTLTPEKITHISLAVLSTVAITSPKTKNPVAMELPPMPAIEAPVTIPTEKITHITPAALNTVAIIAPKTKKPAAVELPPAPVIEAPVTVTPEKITRISVTTLSPVAITSPTTKKPRTQPVMPLPQLVVDIPPAPRNIDKIVRLTPVPPRLSNIIFVIEDKVFTPRKLPSLPPLKLDIPKTPITKTQPATNEPAPFKKADYTVTTEDAKETTVEIYITNGHGKFYTSTPQMVLMEPGTNKVIKTFYRTVDANGNPDAQTNLPVGTYNIALSSKKTLGLNNVKIEQNKKNKITVTVKPASLSFAYDNAPERPIVEFMARVTERNKAQGRVQDQKCTAALEYDPGNYHIMINTFPQIDRNTDIDFDETIIQIPQPGFVKFTHDDKTRVVVLYKQEGDRFLSFHTLDLKDVDTQPLRIQPGAYQAHYHKGPGGASASEKVITFLVKATQLTTVDLN